MRKILIAGLVLSTSFLAEANTNRKDIEESVCRDMMDYAEMAMGYRQEGTSLSTSLKVIDKMKESGKHPETSLNMLRFLIIKAHAEPKFSVKENQQEAINEFASKQYLSCIDHFSKK